MNPKVGLLGLYLKLYDEVEPEKRERMDGFYGQVAGELQRRGTEVVTAPLCRVREEFESAVRRFEQEGALAIVTLHLAYSPSLESAPALARTPLPVIVCDTTPAAGYGPDQSPEELMYNHGIHGVQDMCNLLLRHDKPFVLEAGHWQDSDVLDRVARHVSGAHMAAHMRSMRAGLIGQPFEGMGDFHVAPAALRKSMGVQAVPLKPSVFRTLLAAVSDEEAAREEEEDRGRFTWSKASPEAVRRSVRTGLALRRWIAQERLGAFSFNFRHIDRSSPLETVPFLEASKLMAQGIGYGGEGDLLTASLVGALAAVNPETSFTEMFCPDWKNGWIYLSHMGEMNWRLADGKPRLIEMDYHFSDTGKPALVAGRFRPGRILLVNLAPLGEQQYRLIIAPAEMIEVKGRDKMEKSVHGWFEPQLPLADFLAAYSYLGGTHHLALTYQEDATSVETFGEMMGWDTVVVS